MFSSCRIANVIKNAMIKRVTVEGKKKYRVFNEKGTRPFGTYDTLEEAKKRLSQMEYFKHIKGSK